MGVIFESETLWWWL